MPDPTVAICGVHADRDSESLTIFCAPGSEVHRLLLRAAQDRAAVPSRLHASAPGNLTDEWIVEMAGSHGWWSGDDAKALRTRVRHEYERLALALAAPSATYMPSLPNAASWESSEVHRAARDVVCALGRRAYRKGWTRLLLANRIEQAVDFVLQARGVGLGAPPVEPVISTSTPARSSLRVPTSLIEAVIAAGGDPITDSRTRIAYRLSLPAAANTTTIVADDAALARLREAPELADRYVRMRWLRYPPLSAVLARGVLLKELVLFSERVMETPTGVLDGSMAVGESVSFAWSGRGRRPRVLWAIRALQAIIGRAISTGIIYALGVAAEISIAGWIAVGWFVGARHIRRLALGKSSLERKQELLTVLARTFHATAGDDVPIAGLRHALQTAVLDGAAFDPALWRLIAVRARVAATSCGVRVRRTGEAHPPCLRPPDTAPAR